MTTETEPTLEDLRKRAAELDVTGRSKMNAEALKHAIAKAEAEADTGNGGGDPPSDDDAPSSDAQVRADELARTAEAGGVETRAISVGNVVRNRRVNRGGRQFAETRSIYKDPAGRRRVVGAGQPIPAGWTRVETAELEDRSRNAVDAQGDADVSHGGASR